MYFKIILFTLIICIINQVKITENAPLNEESSTLEYYYNKNLEYLEMKANGEFLKSTTLPSLHEVVDNQIFKYNLKNCQIIVSRQNLRNVQNGCSHLRLLYHPRMFSH